MIDGASECATVGNVLGVTLGLNDGTAECIPVGVSLGTSLGEVLGHCVSVVGV